MGASRGRRDSLSLGTLLGRLTDKAKGGNVLMASTNADELAQCSHMLLYLNDQTWTRSGEASAALATVLNRLMA